MYTYLPVKQKYMKNIMYTNAGSNDSQQFDADAFTLVRFEFLWAFQAFCSETELHVHVNVNHGIYPLMQTMQLTTVRTLTKYYYQ